MHIALMPLFFMQQINLLFVMGMSALTAVAALP